MTTLAPQNPKLLEGIKQLDELMTAGGVTVTAAVVGRPQMPEALGGAVPDIYGTEDQVPAAGKVVLVDLITRPQVKDDLHKLAQWARQRSAKLYLGLIGQPGKGFHGFEQRTVVDDCKAAGWELIQL